MVYIVSFLDSATVKRTYVTGRPKLAGRGGRLFRLSARSPGGGVLVVS
jgi:hypothetical protein